MIENVSPIVTRHEASFLSPPASARPRSSTVSSVGLDDDGASSSDDSVLSWWSDEEEDSEGELDHDKEIERKRREEERLKMLATAGLKLRREPPGIPNRAERKVSRRRPAPAAPTQRRRHAPPVPLQPTSTDEDNVVPITPDESSPVDPPPEQELQDAYARYEQFVAQSKSANSRPRSSTIQRPSSQVVTPQLTGTRVTPTSPTASSTHLSTGKIEGGGRLTGFFSRIMAPSETPKRVTPAISGPLGPIMKIDTPMRDGTSAEDSADTNAVGEEEDVGKTWSSLVDPAVLQSMDERERKRQEAIYEFITTEAAYVRDLQLMVEVCPFAFPFSLPFHLCCLGRKTDATPLGILRSLNASTGR